MTPAGDVYADWFDRVEREHENVPWLFATRQAAYARFRELGFPTTRDEEWKYTNLSTLASTPFAPPPDAADSITERELAPFTVAGMGGWRIVLVNGRFVPALSNLPSDRSLEVMSLAEAMQTRRDLVQAHLTKHASWQEHAVVALNTALMSDGAFVHVPKGRRIKEPVHVLYVATSGAEPWMSHVRNLFVAEADSQVRLVESYAGLGEGTYFTNVVTEIVCGDGAVVEHVKVERESLSAYHLATLHLYLQRSSNAQTDVISLGGGQVRHDVIAILDGEGADATINGLYVLTGEQHVDNHLRVIHAQPHGNSREFFRGILDEASRGIFTGRIIVRPGAQKTDAKQSNATLLLSRRAQAESKPQLEIFADDVKCTHGATIGQVDRDAMFYLRSRGLRERAARGLLIHAFAIENLERISIPELRAELETLVESRFLHAAASPEYA
jgi:Fe-S cluster assembly protein SufD